MGNYNQFFKAARAAKSDAPSVPRRRRGKRKPMPLGPIVAVTIGLVASLWALNNLEKFSQLISIIDIRMFGSAMAADTPPAKTDTSANTKQEKPADAKEAPKVAKDSSVTNWTPEQLAIFNKLEDRKQALDQKEAELTKLEEELQKQKVELDERLKKLDQLRTKISERLTERVSVDQERVDKLVEIYSNMKPQNAAKIFEEIDEDLAVEVLGKMKKKNMAEILNLLKADKAQRLSERFAGYKVQLNN